MLSQSRLMPMLQMPQKSLTILRWMASVVLCSRKTHGTNQRNPRLPAHIALLTFRSQTVMLRSAKTTNPSVSHSKVSFNLMTVYFLIRSRPFHLLPLRKQEETPFTFEYQWMLSVSKAGARSVKTPKIIFTMIHWRTCRLCTTSRY